MTVQHVYALFYNDEFNEPQAVYVGTTARTVEERFAEHLKGILDLSTSKDLYHYCRKKKLVDRLYVETLESRDVVEGAETSTWEHFWVEELVKLGHPLQNSKHGNTSPTVKKGPDLFKTVNSEAVQRTKAALVEWEKGVGFTVVEKFQPNPNELTRAETLRQKIINAVPTLSELTEAQWIEREPKKRWVVSWGKYFISLKKTSAGFDLNIFDEELRRDFGCLMVTTRREAVYEWAITNWLKPTCWNLRKVED